MIYYRATHITERRTFPHPATYKLWDAFFQPFIIEIQTQEARIILAIEAIRTSKKLSKRSVANIYKVPKVILRHRIAGRTYRPKIKANCYKLNNLEEDTIILYILNLDLRGFAPRIASV